MQHYRKQVHMEETDTVRPSVKGGDICILHLILEIKRKGCLMYIRIILRDGYLNFFNCSDIYQFTKLQGKSHGFLVNETTCLLTNIIRKSIQDLYLDF